MYPWVMPAIRAWKRTACEMNLSRSTALPRQSNRPASAVSIPLLHRWCRDPLPWSPDPRIRPRPECTAQTTVLTPSWYWRRSILRSEPPTSRPWATEAVVMVAAGEASATRVLAAGQMLRSAGVATRAAVVVGAERDDETFGMPLEAAV